MMVPRTLDLIAPPALRPLSALSALLALLVTAHPLTAQRALGLGDDAATLPKGVLRVGAGLQWDRANERYDAQGKLRTLGASASTSSWNGQYNTSLAATAYVVSALSGVAAFDPSLGALTIQRRDASADNLIGVEFGLLPPLAGHVGKAERRRRIAERALADFDGWWRAAPGRTASEGRSRRTCGGGRGSPVLA